MIQKIGNHKVVNASIDNPIVDTLFQAGEKASVFYSDPPWGDGNLRYWVTINKRMTGAEYTPLSYEALISRITGLIRNHTEGHVFIETGKAWEQETVEALQSVIHKIRVYKLLYRSGSKMLENILIYGVTDPSIPTMTFDPTGMSGVEVVNKCVGSISTPDGILFDPCCGMGYSANAALKSGMRFYGNEFNAKRLQKTIDRLNKTK